MTACQADRKQTWQSFGMGCVLGVVFMVIAIPVLTCGGCYMMLVGGCGSSPIGNQNPTEAGTSSQQEQPDNVESPSAESSNNEETEAIDEARN